MHNNNAKYFCYSYMRTGFTSCTISYVTDIVITIAAISLIIIVISICLAVQALALQPQHPTPPAPHINRIAVAICHISPENPANRQTITIDATVIRSYLRNHPGDTVGHCNTQPINKIAICHISPENPANRQTITIDATVIRSYLRNHPGDTVGPCRSLA
jgi:hypothetical protein